VSTVRGSPGVTESEKILGDLCKRAFLRVWSHQNLYRDQGRNNGRGDGKELVDVLIVCGEDVIIFSDKSCHFSTKVDVGLAWDRWYRNSIVESAAQTYGAERWLKEFPGRIYRDRRCTIPFEAEIPSADVARIHRVAVASGLKQASIARPNVEPSLRLSPGVVGEDHFTKKGGVPFVIGQVDPARGYVHIWDARSVERLLQELDTISDLLRYLRWKEDLITSGRLLTAASESDLLGYFMLSREEEPTSRAAEGNPTPLTIKAGSWKKWANSKLRANRYRENRVSYFCDELINQMTDRILQGETLDPVADPYASAELAFGRFAREPRLTRRAIAQGWLERLTDPALMAAGAARVLRGIDGHTVYVIIIAPKLPGQSEEQYRDLRFKFLEGYCFPAMAAFSPPVHLIGFAMDPRNTRLDGLDVLYFDPAKWTAEAQTVAAKIRQEQRILTDVQPWTRFLVDTPGGRTESYLKQLGLLSAPRRRRP
jgi:hypothetical protein